MGRGHSGPERQLSTSRSGSGQHPALWSSYTTLAGQATLATCHLSLGFAEEGGLGRVLTVRRD